MKNLFKSEIDDTHYINSTHKVNLTGGEISTILYYLDQVADDIGDAYIPSLEVQRIYAELESVTDNYYSQLEAQDDNNYAECVDHLVKSMEVN